MSSRGRFVFPIVFVLVGLFFAPAVSSMDIGPVFSMPSAPDAGQIVGLTVYRGLYVVPLNNGTVKFYGADGEGDWSAMPGSGFLEDWEGVRGLSILEQGCEERGLGELSVVSVHAPLFLFAEKRVYEPGSGPHLFWKSSADALDGGFLTGPYVSQGCLLAWMTRARGTDRLWWETPDAEGSFAIRGAGGGLLDGIVPPGQIIRGLELTTAEDGIPVLLVATDEAVYAVSFTEGGTEVQTQGLNHIPRFVGEMSSSCAVGTGPVTLEVTAADADGDPLTITQTNDQPGFDGTMITLDCSRSGVFEWTFTASDGKTDEADLPEGTYRIAVTVPRNRPPVWSDFTVYGAAGVVGTLPPARDPDGDPLTYCLYTCDPNVPPSPPWIIPVYVRPDGSYRSDRNGVFRYPVAVSDGKLETVVTGTFDIGFDIGCDPPLDSIWSCLVEEKPVTVMIPQSSCTQDVCLEFGSRVFAFQVDEGASRLNVYMATRDWKYNADLIVMHEGIPPDFLHPLHPESPFPGVWSLYERDGGWNPDAELRGHQYYWSINRRSSDELISIANPPPGWYYIKIMNTSDQWSSVEVMAYTMR